MFDTRRLIRVVAVLAIAAATGYVMQNGTAVASRGDQAPADGARPAVAAMSATAMPIQPGPGEDRPLQMIPGAADAVVRLIVPQPLNDPFSPHSDNTADVVRLAALETDDDASVDILVSGVADMAACAATLTATAEPAAMARLTFLADCRPNARVIIGHSGLEFAILTDDDGRAEVEVPAFESPAVFTATADGLDPVEQRIDMPTLAVYERVGVAWRGQAGLEIHALEFGADYGTQGDVWHGNAGSAQQAIKARGGFVTQLGNAEDPFPMLAEVYTFPTGLAQRDGIVRLSLEAEVGAANCGQDFSGVARQRYFDGEDAETAISLAIPECDAIGDFLVLKNLFQDLKIARQ